MKKKILCMLLSIVMLLSLLPVASFAETETHTTHDGEASKLSSVK